MLAYKNAGKVRWVTARVDRDCEDGYNTKTVTVNGNPYGSLILRPWSEGAEIVRSSPSGAYFNSTPGHVEWILKESDAKVTLVLNKRCV